MGNIPSQLKIELQKLKNEVSYRTDWRRVKKVIKDIEDFIEIFRMLSPFKKIRN